MKFFEWEFGRTVIHYEIPQAFEEYYDGYFRRGLKRFLEKYIDADYEKYPDHVQVEILCATILELFLEEIREYKEKVIKDVEKIENVVMKLEVMDDWDVTAKSKRSIVIPEDLEAKIQLLASVEGTNFSKMLARVVRKAIEKGDVREEVNRYRGHLLRLDLMEAREKLRIYKEKLQKVIELEEEVENAIKEKLGYIELSEAFDLMVKIIEWLDSRGYYVRGFVEENPDIVDRLNEIFIDTFGCEFPIREFAERVWLKEEMNIKEFVEAVKRGEL